MLQQYQQASPPPTGIQPVDTEALAQSSTPRSEQQLRKALKLQRQHRERDAIEALLAGFDEGIPSLAKAQLNMLTGKSFLKLGGLAEAEGHYRVSLAAAAASSRMAEANAFGNLGLAYQDRGDLAKAEEHHRRALAMDEEIGNKLWQAIFLNNLGLVYRDRGDLGQSRERFAESLRLFEEVGARREAELARRSLEELG